MTRNHELYDPVSRRGVLFGTASVVSLAGCTQLHGATPPNHPDQEYVTGTQRVVTLSGVDSLPDDSPLSIDVRLEDGIVTDETPATLEITVRFEESTTVPVYDEMCAILNRDDQSSDPHGVWLYLPPNAPIEDKVENLWVPDWERSRDVAFPSYACSEQTYGPKTELSWTYQVWDDYSVAGYLEPGTYRFERQIPLSDDDSAIKWGFDLQVEYPERP